MDKEEKTESICSVCNNYKRNYCDVCNKLYDNLYYTRNNQIALCRLCCTQYVPIGIKAKCAGCDKRFSISDMRTYPMFWLCNECRDYLYMKSS